MQCFAKGHETNQLSARFAVLCLLDLHTPKRHLQQLFYPYWQMPIVANSSHDKIIHISCFGKNSSDMEQHVYMRWYLKCDIYTLISEGIFYFSSVFSVSLFLFVCLEVFFLQ